MFRIQGSGLRFWVEGLGVRGTFLGIRIRVGVRVWA